MKKITLFLSLFIILIGCNTSKKTPTMEDDLALNYKWELSMIEDQPIKDENIKGEVPYIEFTGENRISGFLGCNRLMGFYKLNNGHRLSFDQLGTTRMACLEMGELENHLLEVLNKVASYTIQDQTLTLKSEQGDLLAIFTKAEKNEIVNKYWKLKTLDGQMVEMAENQEREQYFILKNDSTVTGFSGCNNFQGQYVQKKGNRISFSNMASTMKLCPDVDLNEIDFLEVFELTDNYTINGDTLRLNIGRRAPLAVFEAVYFD